MYLDAKTGFRLELEYCPVEWSKINVRWALYQEEEMQRYKLSGQGSSYQPSTSALGHALS